MSTKIPDMTDSAKKDATDKRVRQEAIETIDYKNIQNVQCAHFS